MKISLNWLKQHVDGLDMVNPRELGLKLTMATVEVDSVEELGGYLENVVVGKIIKIDKHPNADRLKVVTVSLGDKEVTAVCGGTNLREEMLVALALPGAKVRWHGEGEPIVLETAKVRGVESAGMICASEEIGLSSLYPAGQANEIIDLSENDFPVGAALSKSLGLDDVIYEIDNKSLTNRPDLWGYYGLAREVAALYGLKLKDYKPNKIKTGREVNLKVKVADFAACPRYIGVALRGIKVTESPAWLKKRLEAIGQKPINNIVDITNYVMFDLGEPLHAFSSDKIKNSEIIIRFAKEKEKLITLDGVSRLLSLEDLVIADQEKAVALAGVIGGANSEINEKTETIVIEAANFNPVMIRKTAQRLGLRTEAAMRFEKSLDPNLAELAIKKSVNLIQEIIPGAVVASQIIDEKKFTLNQELIKLTWNFIEQRIGQNLGERKILDILSSLGFEVKHGKDGFSVKAPTWRATKDISVKEDIIEEITRIYGYDNLIPEMPVTTMEYWSENKLRGLEREIKNILTLAVGADEVCNYSFADKKFLDKLGHPSINAFELANPWSDDLCLMRQSLVPHLLKNLADNLRFGQEVSIFESGKVFIDDRAGLPISPDSPERLPSQDLIAAGIISSENSEPFYQAKGAVETIFTKLGIGVDYAPASDLPPWCHPRQNLQITLGREVIGFVAALHPAAAAVSEIKRSAAVWQINLTKLLPEYPSLKKIQPLPKFPAVELDLSILVGEDVEWGTINNLAKAIAPALIRDIQLLDVFKNDKIKSGSKSLTFRIIYQAADRTLEKEEVNELQTKILIQLEKAVGAKIRR